MRFARRPALALLLVFQVGCGTLFSGTRQRLAVSTEPVGANVALYRLDGEPVPVERSAATGELSAPRPVHGVPYLSVISSPGHCPEYAITRVGFTPGTMAEAFLLAIPFIQLIGAAALAVDNASGGYCSIKPIVSVLEEGPECR